MNVSMAPIHPSKKSFNVKQSTKEEIVDYVARMVSGNVI